jgi:hypothetical protein
MALIESSPSASFVLLKFGLRFPTKWKSILIAIRSDPYQCEEMAYEAKLTRTAPHGSLGYLTPAEYAPDFAYPVSFATLPLRSQLNGSAGASPSQRQVNQSTSQPVDKSTSRQVNQSTSQPVDKSTSRQVNQSTSQSGETILGDLGNLAVDLFLGDLQIDTSWNSEWIEPPRGQEAKPIC